MKHTYGPAQLGRTRYAQQEAQVRTREQIARAPQNQIQALANAWNAGMISSTEIPASIRPAVMQAARGY
jgi:hypothetical protein